MVDIETVLVLGAGASKDFGFPTGRELVKQICRILSDRRSKLFDLYYVLAGRQSPDMAEKFPVVLEKADPSSVDAWLEHNTEFMEVGKIAIAIALLTCEQNSNLRPENNWYHELFQRLDSPFEKFQDNNLSIITFNYDRSLEQYLFETFRHTHYYKGEEDCIEKLNQLRILHVYGSLGRLSWQSENSEHPIPQVYYGANLDENTVLSSAISIEIIPEKSQDLPKKFKEARILITFAKALYFLGFGYHKTNMERWGIDTLRRPSKVMGTCYKMRHQDIREVERLSLRELQRGLGLVPKPVYEFIHDYVDFNAI